MLDKVPPDLGMDVSTLAYYSSMRYAGIIPSVHALHYWMSPLQTIFVLISFQFFTPTFRKFSTFFAFFRFFDPPVRCFSVCEDGNGKTKGNRQRATDSDSGCALLAATRSGARERTRNVAWAFSLAPALPRFYRAG